MDAGATAFYVVAVVTLAASLGVVVTRSVVYSALLLVASLMLTGLVYLILLADFLALVQILIYGGTVSVLLLYALMLTRPQERPILNHRGWPLAVLSAIVLFAILMYQSVGTSWLPTPVATRVTAGSSSTAASATTAATGAALTGPVRIGPDALGTALFTTWGVPFEIASLVLLVALMGSLVIARGTPGQDEVPVPDMPEPVRGGVGES